MCHAESGQGHLSSEGLIPRDLIGRMGPSVGIEVFNVIEPSGFHRLDDVRIVDEGREGISNLNPLFNAHMVCVVGVVLVKHHPFIASELCTFLQHAIDSREALDAIGGVASSLNLVSTIECVIIEGKVLKVALHTLAKVGETQISIVMLPMLT